MSFPAAGRWESASVTKTGERSSLFWITVRPRPRSNVWLPPSSGSCRWLRAGRGKLFLDRMIIFPYSSAMNPDKLRSTLQKALRLLDMEIDKLPFKLPKPPKGRKWYQAKHFRAGDLPKGFRPLLAGEVPQCSNGKIRTHYWDFDEKHPRWAVVCIDSSLSCSHRRGWPRCKMRTTAPLPKAVKKS